MEYLLLWQVRDSVMTRVSLNWSQDNEVTIAGLGMLTRLGLTRKDLQVSNNTCTQCATERKGSD